MTTIMCNQFIELTCTLGVNKIPYTLIANDIYDFFSKLVSESLNIIV